MKFFLDSARVDEIEQAIDLYDIDGVTTNPRHVLDSGKPFLTVIGEIAQVVKGTDKTVSVEVNPHLMTWEEMVAEGEKLAAISPNFVIKLQCVDPAFKAIRTLSERGIRVNTTLIFSAMQALQAMRSGAFYVSPFIGWKEFERGRDSEFRARYRLHTGQFRFHHGGSRRGSSKCTADC